MTYSCGSHLDACRCAGGYIHILRTWAEVDAAHQASVARARRSGFAREPLLLWLWQELDPGAFRTTGRRAA